MLSADDAVHTNILFLKKQILLNRQQNGGNNGGLKPSDRKVLSHILSYPDYTASEIAERSLSFFTRRRNDRKNRKQAKWSLDSHQMTSLKNADPHFNVGEKYKPVSLFIFFSSIDNYYCFL